MLAILPISTSYQVFGLLHVLAAFVAFGPLFLYPRLQRNGETATIANLHMRLVFPALVLQWVFGMGMAGIGEYNIAETWWMSISILIWVAMLLVSWFLIRPAIADQGDSAKAKMSAGIGVTHLGVVVALWLMIFQPGGSTFN